MDDVPLHGGETSEKIIFLHGDLDLSIIEARSLPNMDMLSERFRRCFTVFNACKSSTPTYESGSDVEAASHKHHHKIITSDPYVSVVLAGATVARTRVIPNSQDPCWNEHFHVPLAHMVGRVEFHVKDNDVFGAQLIGISAVPAQRLLNGEVIQQWFHIIGTNGKPPKPDSALFLSLHFNPFENNPCYRNGIGADPDFGGVPNAYFPLRRGGMVTLYQDAHVPDGCLPQIPLDGGRVFRHEKCWEDICHAILEAHHMIYIVGWSVYDKVKLVREPTRPLPSGGELTLGELLKYKSQEGVRVCLLVWDDKTSHKKLFVNLVCVLLFSELLDSSFHAVLSLCLSRSLPLSII